MAEVCSAKALYSSRVGEEEEAVEVAEAGSETGNTWEQE